MGAFYTNPQLWYSLGGALLAYTGLNFGKVAEPVKPAMVGVIKEGYIFKNWVSEKVETSKEDLEDIVAEAKYSYEQDLLEASKAIENEKLLLEKVDKVIQKRSNKIKKLKK